MKNAAIASAILHVLTLILFGISIGNPFQKTIKDQQPIVVDFVQIAEKSAAPKLSPLNQKMDEPKVEPKEEKKPEPEAPKPEPEENRVEKPKEPEPPKELEKPEDKPVEKPKEPEPKEDVAPVLKKEPEKKPEKKPEPPKKPEKKPEKKPDPKKDKKDPKKKDAKDKKKKDEKAEINLRKNKSKSDKKPDPKNKKPDSKAALDDLLKEVDSDGDQDGSPAETVGEVITATQIDAIRQKIRKCWLVPAGLKGAKDMVVDIKMEIAPDGTVKTAEIVDKSRMAQDNGFRTAAENAKRAVLDPECNPLPLPKEKYEQWKDLEMSFNPKDMF